MTVLCPSIQEGFRYRDQWRWKMLEDERRSNAIASGSQTWTWVVALWWKTPRRIGKTILWLLSVWDWIIHGACKYYAGFRLACRLPLCRYAAWSPLAVSWLQLSAAMRLWLIIEWWCFLVEFKSTVCGRLQWAKRQGYRFIGKTLLGHPSSTSGPCSVVQVSSSKQENCWAASLSESSIKVGNSSIEEI